MKPCLYRVANIPTSNVWEPAFSSPDVFAQLFYSSKIVLRLVGGADIPEKSFLIIRPRSLSPPPPSIHVGLFYMFKKLSHIKSVRIFHAYFIFRTKYIFRNICKYFSDSSILHAAAHTDQARFSRCCETDLTNQNTAFRNQHSSNRVHVLNVQWNGNSKIILIVNYHSTTTTILPQAHS